MNQIRLTLAGSVLLCLVGLPAQVQAQAKEMPGGLWEMRMKMDMPGMPPEMAAQMGNRVVTQCVKPGEKKWNEQRDPSEKGERRCEQTDLKVSGNTTAWKMKCVDGTTGEGTITHNGKDAYKMDMVMNSPRGSMKMQTEGKRIADTCEKK